MWGQNHCGYNYMMPAFDASTGYNWGMPAYYRGNVHCSGKCRNGTTFVLLVVLFILLIIVGSTFY